MSSTSGSPSCARVSGVYSAVASNVLPEGASIVGGLVSVMLSVCVSLLLFPEASVAVQVMLCVPTAYGPVGE